MLKIKKYIRTAAPSSAGFSCIELLCALAILGILAAIILPSIIGFKKVVEHCLVKNKAQVLAADLRRVQAMSRYRTQGYNSILFDTQKERYWFMENIKRYENCDLAIDGYGLNAVNKSNAFYHRGTVNVYNYINIWRKTQLNYIYEIQVLPVTGRVGVYKK